MVSIRRFFSGIKAKIYEAAGKKAGIDVKIREKENGEYVATVNMKKGVDALPTTMTNPDTVINLYRLQKQEEQYYEPPDKVVQGESVDEQYEDLPDYYQDAIFPAKVKPNITAIKEWVIKVKLNNLNHRDVLLELYGESFTQEDIAKDNSNKIDHLVDSIAYKISRKIWYVGRRPSSMTDYQWDRETRHLRPAEGTYGKRDEWKTFKYDTNYEYTSGVF